MLVYQRVIPSIFWGCGDFDPNPADGPTLEIRLLPSPRPNANAQSVGQFRQGGQDLPGCPFGEKGRCRPSADPEWNPNQIKSINQPINQQSAFQQGNQTTKQPSNHAWQMPQNTWKKSAGLCKLLCNNSSARCHPWAKSFVWFLWGKEIHRFTFLPWTLPFGGFRQHDLPSRKAHYTTSSIIASHVFM